MKERSFDAFHGEGRPWKVLFVGMGSIGRRHLRLMKRLAPVEAYRWRSQPGDRRGGDSVPGAEEVSSLDAGIALGPHFAVVSNPPACHVPPATRLAEAGIPLFIEKPVSHGMEGLDRLLDAVEEKRLAVMVGYQWRCHPAFETMREVIAEKKIGRPLCGARKVFCGEAVLPAAPGEGDRKSLRGAPWTRRVDRPQANRKGVLTGSREEF